MWERNLGIRCLVRDTNLECLLFKQTYMSPKLLTTLGACIFSHLGLEHKRAQSLFGPVTKRDVRQVFRMR